MFIGNRPKLLLHFKLHQSPRRVIGFIDYHVPRIFLNSGLNGFRVYLPVIFCIKLNGRHLAAGLNGSLLNRLITRREHDSMTICINYCGSRRLQRDLPPGEH